MSSPLKRIVKNFGVLLSGQFIVTGLGFLALTLNTRALEPADLGRLFLVQATCELISKVIAFQNWQTFIKLGAEDEAGENPVTPLWVFGVTLDFAAAAIAAVISGVLLAFFPGVVGLDPETGRWGLVYAAALLFSGTSTCIGTLRLYDAFSQVVTVNSVQAALLLVNAAVLFWLDAPLAAYLVVIPLVVAVTSVAMIVLGWRKLRQTHPGDTRLWPDAGQRRRFLSFAFGVSASGSLTAFRQRGEMLMVGAILDPAAAALFGVAYRMSALVARFAQSARVSVYPEFSRMVASGGFSDAAALAFKLTRWTAAVAAIAMLVIVFAGGEILALLFGETFRAALPNLVLLGLGSAIYACIFAFGPLVQITFGSWRFFAFTLTAFAGFVVAGALGPYLFGQPAAGAGAAVYSIILATLLTVQIRRHAKKQQDT
ncbi:lipopolysaccharide biosynthesis protein [Citreimonas sp.]|uniref:lipopolysaccharide biosynthesis protein n=1 Tax=Citreimonas sp. TaxID=3036715 RepID=UPI0035C81255